MQLEIPIQTVEYAARRAFEKGVKVVLNPAPARSLPKELLRYLFMITPNRIEAEMLTGIKIVNDADAERDFKRNQDPGYGGVQKRSIIVNLRIFRDAW